MSYPILYESAETKFDTNGIGVLSDCLSCICVEERNGTYEIQFVYPADGIHFGDIVDRSIVVAKPNPVDDPQPFRVYRYTAPINGQVLFYARHISYDLLGIPVSPFFADNVMTAIEKLKQNAVVDCPYTFWTDKATKANMDVTVPTPIRNLLGGQRGSILDVYGGGEYKFDRYDVRLYQNRGADRGVNIRYGKNMLDLEQERNCANVYTGVYPYWSDTNGENLVQLPDKIVKGPGEYDHERIMTLDLSSEWQDAPTEEQLRNRALAYIESNNIGVPSVSLKIEHAMLEQTEEYKDRALLERIDLCDIASIEFPQMRISTSAEAVKVEFNVLTGRYESITFGDARTNLTDTVANQGSEIKESTSNTRSLVGQAMEKINDTVQNASGMYTTTELQQDESTITYLHDKRTLVESKNVIKITSEAVGVSTDGGKTYPFGLYVNGDLVSNILSAIGINADWVNAGILQSQPDENGNRTFYLDLVGGILKMHANEFEISGRTVEEISVDKANDALKSAKTYANEAVNNFVSAVYNPKIVELQKQIDGQIESYFYDYEPALDNVPASTWMTDEDKEKHEGDLFYWKSKGYAYRFFRDGDTWKWQLVKDTDVTKALEDAANASATANSKMRVFVTEPTPPYDVGDLWAEGPNGEIMRCMNARASGKFDVGDWEKASKYTDDSALKSFLDGDYRTTVEDLKKQADQKAETWYQADDPSGSWGAHAEHVGDMWYCTDAKNASRYQKFWRWSGSEWQEMTSTPPDSVFNRINGKAQIFAAEPKPPYNVGDLWVQGDGGDILYCKTPRENDDYNAGDWVKASDYINKEDAEKAAKDAVNRDNIAEAMLDNLAKYAEDGIYSERIDDKIRIGINASAIRVGVLDAQRVKISGDYGSLVQSYGMIDGYERVPAIAICGPNGYEIQPYYDSGSGTQKEEIVPHPPYIIISSEGARIQASNTVALYATRDGVTINGTVWLRKLGYESAVLYAEESLQTSGEVLAGQKVWVGAFDGNYNGDGNGLYAFTEEGAGHVLIASGGARNLIYTGVAEREYRIHCNALISDKPLSTSSDKRDKKDIGPITDAYEKLIDLITPVRYRYKSDPDDAPMHFGYTTDDIVSALESVGLSRNDMAALVDYENSDGEKRVGLTYSEMIALLHVKIHSMEKRLKKLEG